MSADATGQEAASASTSRDQITLLAQFVAKPGRESDICNGLLRLVEAARAEPGCLGYDLYQPQEDPAVMFFYENWSDSRALATHMNTPHFSRYVRREVDPRLVVPWTAHMMAMVSQPSR